VTESSFTKLRVFISWSGGRSQKAAQGLRDWLPSVLQNVKPYFTPDDIDKGSRWSGEIRSELEGTDFGIICLTRENLSAPWILFEAGALSKLGKSKVAPLLLDLEPTDIVGPLGQLQLTRSNKDECFKLLISINRALGQLGLEQNVLEGVFDRWWPDLEQKFKQALEVSPTGPVTKRRPDRDMLEEVLERVRALQMRESARYRRMGTPAQIMSRLARNGYPPDTSLSKLSLSPRALACLEGEGITQLYQLLELSPIDLLKVPNLGKRAQLEVIEALNELGITLHEG